MKQRQTLPILLKEQPKTLGIEMNTPCAIVSSASRKDQSVQVGTLDNLSIFPLTSKRAAIIVFGIVVDFLNEFEKYDTHKFKF